MSNIGKTYKVTFLRGLDPNGAFKNFLFSINQSKVSTGSIFYGVSEYSYNTDEYAFGEYCEMGVSVADTDNTNDVAVWFNDGTGGNSIGCNSNDSNPEELEFAFEGTMRFSIGDTQYESPINSIYIGFGSGCWWIGGPGMKVENRSKDNSTITQIFYQSTETSPENKVILTLATVNGDKNLFDIANIVNVI